ncbi:MAG: fatty acid desaturase [Pseudomonadota bacterium]|nr:fatty acid desaturase [Pseudomonadota bacterium]MDE3037154.1 fatty acid desaturase [Pseudomonadota bacterium]
MCVVFSGTMFQLFGLPVMLRVVGMRAVWFLVPITLLQPLHWGLIHEAIHSRLLPKRRANDFYARLLSIMHWLPYDATRFGHLVHHRFSRHCYDQPDVYYGHFPYFLAWLGFRARLFGGVYLGLLTSPLIAFMPVTLGARLMANRIPIVEEGDEQIQRLFMSLAMNESKRRRTRREFVMALALYGASVWSYGAWWPVLLSAMYMRGVWHSFADNVAHHAVPMGERDRSRNYTLPRPFQLLVMNQQLHLMHHRYPAVPWASLTSLDVHEDERPRGNYFLAAIRQMDRAYPIRAPLRLAALKAEMPLSPDPAESRERSWAA